MSQLIITDAIVLGIIDFETETLPDTKFAIVKDGQIVGTYKRRTTALIELAGFIDGLIEA